MSDFDTAFRLLSTALPDSVRNADIPHLALLAGVAVEVAYVALCDLEKAGLLPVLING